MGVLDFAGQISRGIMFASSPGNPDQMIKFTGLFSSFSSVGKEGQSVADFASLMTVRPRMISTK